MEKDGPGSQGVLTPEHELAPLTARELDQQFPGIMNGVALMVGGASVILQLAHPWVSSGVMERQV